MTQSVAHAVWAAGLIVWFIIRWPYQRRARKIAVVSDRRSLGDRLVLAAAGIGLSLVPLIYVATGYPAVANYPFRPSMGWVGTALLIVCLVLFHVSHRQLGKNWSVTLEIRDKHQLVTDGLYRYVRHPMYSSFWLWAIAQAFLIANFVAGFAGLVGVGLLYFYRVGREEALMRKSFGRAYDAYAARTGRVIPRVF
jgi:protein-S-isoprenylcysteine O-methyltransferase Ste14